MYYVLYSIQMYRIRMYYILLYIACDIYRLSDSKFRRLYLRPNHAAQTNIWHLLVLPAILISCETLKSQFTKATHTYLIINLSTYALIDFENSPLSLRARKEQSKITYEPPAIKNSNEILKPLAVRRRYPTIYFCQYSCEKTLHIFNCVLFFAFSYTITEINSSQ